MDIVIDSGNYSTKIGFFAGDKLDKIKEIRSFDEIIDFVQSQKFNNAIISTVKYPSEDFSNQLKTSGNILILDHRTPLPIRNLYKTPETLGMDRLAAAVGGWHLFPDMNLLIIDAGTCTTFDFLNADGEYVGGSISPGIDLRLRSLHDYTENLPLVINDGNYDVPGQTTKDSVKSGSIGGAIAEAEGFISQYQREYNSLRVILTGGNYKLFESKIKGNIFTVRNLVMTGLHRILLYNV